MRPDMYEVIIERPRYHGNGGKSTPIKGYNKNKDIEDLPSKEGMTRRCGSTKSLNENLAPLERFLRKQVGRPWNKVYSEICEHISVNSQVQKHVRDHIKSMVETNVKIINRVPHVVGGRHWMVTTSGWRPLYNNNLYVCPKSGILKLYREKKSTPEPKETVLINVNDKIRYEKIKGIWYEVEVKEVVQDKLFSDCVINDSLFFYDRYSLKRTLIKAHGTNSNGKCVYAVKKRQMNKREIKKLVLPRVSDDG